MIIKPFKLREAEFEIAEFTAVKPFESRDPELKIAESVAIEE